MYKLILSLFSVLVLNHLVIANEIYKVDLNNSQLKWEGRKVTGAHHGTINLQSGSLEVVDSKLSGGEFTIDMNSMINLDLEDETWNKKLIDHLKSDDFFSVEKFPIAKFKITDIKNYKDSDTEANYLIIGDLSIKGITHSIEFPAVFKVEEGKVTASAKIEIDRSKYDVRFGSSSFFKGLGDKMIYDNFTMDVELTATK
ncbi:MAG: YceI family protein [Calditrichaceae bacterium]|nr:YceI family protein [Calditrichaceae bacterium]